MSSSVTFSVKPAHVKNADDGTAFLGSDTVVVAVVVFFAVSLVVTFCLLGFGGVVSPVFFSSFCTPQ